MAQFKSKGRPRWGQVSHLGPSEPRAAPQRGSDTQARVSARGVGWWEDAEGPWCRCEQTPEVTSSFHLSQEGAFLWGADSHGGRGAGLVTVPTRVVRACSDRGVSPGGSRETACGKARAPGGQSRAGGGGCRMVAAPQLSPGLGLRPWPAPSSHAGSHGRRTRLLRFGPSEEESTTVESAHLLLPKQDREGFQ